MYGPRPYYGRWQAPVGLQARTPGPPWAMPNECYTDEGYGRYGVTAEIASVIAEGAFYDLDAPVKRMGAMHVPIPFSPPLEDATVPTENSVFEAARAICNRD